VLSLIGELTVKTRLIHSAAAVLAAGLLLVSCSSSDSDSEDEEIRGVETGNSQESEDDGEPSEEPEPTPTDDGIDRPEIELPDDMNNVFEDTETGDETQDAIIADVIGRIEVMDMASAAGDPGLEAMEFYNTGEGLLSARQFVRGGTDQGLTWAGTVVYYDFVVDNEGDLATRPIVRYCQDITDLRDKNMETGELLPDSGSGNFLHTQVVVRENDLGVWQVERVLPDDDANDRGCE
jgi:hypothetical protein